MQTDAVTDFHQFAGLRAQARDQNPEVLRRAAQQFEGLLIQQMLKSMRAASPGDDLTGGGQTEFYRDMFDQQLSAHLAGGKGLGIADLLVRQLRGRSEATADATPEAASPQAAPALPARGGGVANNTATPTSPSSPTQSTAPAPSAPLPRHSLSSFLINQVRSGMTPDATPRWATTPQSAVPPSSPLPIAAEAPLMSAAPVTARGPRAFIDAIRPHAERAAQELGVPSRILMAQAALETGWGRRAIRHEDGQPTFNFFGIKADTRWNGSEVQRMTREFENGNEVRTAASFRAYDTPASAFNDYVRFLKSNPRYADALQHGGDERRFVSGLQKAGYATDPAYADKILRVANGPTLRSALGATRGLSV